MHYYGKPMNSPKTKVDLSKKSCHKSGKESMILCVILCLKQVLLVMGVLSMW